jgi:hypothetical protein
MNAYYIYSVGNVTYSGAGHSFGTVVESEAKLFINTMIAAYQTASTPPSVKIIDPSDPTGERELTDKFYLADDTGALASSSEFQEDSAIYFSVYDPSLGSGKKITAKFIYGTNKEIKLPIYVKGGSVNPINFSSTGDEINYTLSGGVIYYVYPVEELLAAINEHNRIDLEIEIASNLLPNQPASAVITLHRLGLFPLG